MQDSPLTRNFIGSPALCSLLGFSTLEPHFRQIFFGYMSLSIAVIVTELTAGSSWWIVTLTDLQQLVNLASMVPVHFLSFSFLPFLYKVFIQILIEFFLFFYFYFYCEYRHNEIARLNPNTKSPSDSAPTFRSSPTGFYSLSIS